MGCRVLTAVGVSIVAAWAGSSACAVTPDGVQRNAERASIAASRAEANARFEATTRDCQARFVVTACMNKASRAHRLAIAELHERDLKLNDADRREAAEERRLAIEAKGASAESRASEPAVTRREASRARPPPNAAAPAAVRPDPQAVAAAQAARHASEQRNQAAYDAKVRAAEAHRDAVLRRNEQRAASGKAAKPLPLPARAASAP